MTALKQGQERHMQKKDLQSIDAFFIANAVGIVANLANGFLPHEHPFAQSCRLVSIGGGTIAAIAAWRTGHEKIAAWSALGAFIETGALMCGLPGGACIPSLAMQLGNLAMAPKLLKEKA